MIRVWDPAIRVFHWGLVASFAIAWLSADEVQGLHIWAGYTAAALIAFRLVWGLIGPRYARFSQFLTGPGAALAYLRQMRHGTEPRYLGHNPAGALMIVALLVTLSFTAWTGWMMTGPVPQIAGIEPGQNLTQGDDDGEGNEHGEGGGSEVFKDLHEVAANLMLALVIVHIGGVILASRKTRENLARAMITGTKRVPEPGDIA
ncbi:MAG: cytochrome b/b6 domain-containing protein [Paracoccaceae bacterium]|nr:cytochrome b/b6 domain-containing protein [Paracoccaceae bacterium]